MAHTSAPIPPEASSSPDLAYGSPKTKIYTCGTLKYSMGGLFALFAWLLWGDFCFSLMETVAGTSGNSILALKLKDLGSTNLTMQIILSTLPAFLNLTVCPWVSYKSDRHRGRWGRRIPFILYTLPFLSLSLILIGWSQDITPWVQHIVPALQHTAPATISIVLIGAFGVMFAFFNMFVGSVFYYLFNDVVPPQFLGRFSGLFGMVGTAAAVFYNQFLFQYARSNMREILTGAALLYCFGFLLVCLFVKEGKYPPPVEQPVVAGRRGKLADLVGFFRQSFSTRIYLYIFMTSTLGYMAGATGMWGLFFNEQMGLTLKQMGELASIGGIAAFAATYFTAVFVDRWHPLRIAAYIAIFTAVTGFSSWVWIYVTLPGHVYFWLSMGNGLVGVFGGVLMGATALPLCMRIFPKSLYGQFSSAQSMVRSLGVMIAGLAAGYLMDLVMKAFHGSDFAYRFMFVWPWVFKCGTACFFYLAYREWRRLGADDHYEPPAPWLPGGTEEVTEKVPSVPARPHVVMIALWLGFLAAVLSAVLSGGFIFMMRWHHLSIAEYWYTWTFMPVKLALVGGTWWQLVAIRRDVRNAGKGITTRHGIPHHGVLMVFAIQGLLYFPIFWFQTVWMIEVNLQGEIIFFGIANLLGMAAGILGIQIIRRMESPVATYRPEHALTNGALVEEQLAAT